MSILLPRRGDLLCRRFAPRRQARSEWAARANDHGERVNGPALRWRPCGRPRASSPIRRAGARNPPPAPRRFARHARPVWHGNDAALPSQPAPRTRPYGAPHPPLARRRITRLRIGRMEARMEARRALRIFSPTCSPSNREARFRRRRAWMENRMAEIFVGRENLGIPVGCGRELLPFPDEFRSARRRLSAAAA